MTERAEREWHYSPSQMQKYIPCPRKYHFEYVLGLKPPQSKSAAEGSRIHGEIERAFQGRSLPEDRRALEGISELARVEVAGGAALEGRLRPRDGLETIRFLEGVGPELLIEATVDEPLDPHADGEVRRMIGRVDVADFRRGTPEITDWKTTSDLKYAKTEYELETDVQMNVYAWWALGLAPEADQVVVRHVVIPTRGAARGIATEATLPRADVMGRWSDYLRILDEMDQVRREASPARIDPLGERNGECERYGGCPHLGRCAQLLFGAEERPEMTQDVKARIAELKAKSAQQNGAAGHTPATPVQAVKLPLTIKQTVQPAAESPAEKLARLRALKAGQAAPVTQAPEPDPEPVIEDGPTAEEIELAELEETAFAADQATTPLPDTAADRIRDPAARIAALKAQSTKAEARAGADKAQVQAVKGTIPTQRVEVGSESRIGVLYLDCAPIASDPQRQGLLGHVTLESWSAPAVAAVRAKTGIGWQLHEYRKGTGALCDEVGALEAPDSLVVDTSTPIGKVLLEVLIPRADLVIRGWR